MGQVESNLSRRQRSTSVTPCTTPRYSSASPSQWLVPPSDRNFRVPKMRRDRRRASDVVELQRKRSPSPNKLTLPIVRGRRSRRLSEDCTLLNDGAELVPTASSRSESRSPNKSPIKSKQFRANLGRKKSRELSFTLLPGFIGTKRKRKEINHDAQRNGPPQVRFSGFSF